jgi:hypothetical protein
MQKMIHEILQNVGAEKDKDKKIQLLRQYNCQALREVVKYAFVPQLKFFTNEVPKYKIDNVPEGMSFNSLFNESRRFYILTSPATELALSGKTTTIARKQQILLQILENIHPKEAEVVASMIVGDFSKKYGITKKIVEEAYPQIFK